MEPTIKEMCFTGRFYYNTQIQGLTKIRPVEDELLQANEQTYRHDGANSPLFRNIYEKTPVE